MRKPVELISLRVQSKEVCVTGSQKAELDALHRIQVFLQENTDALGPVNQSPPRAAPT